MKIYDEQEKVEQAGQQNANLPYAWLIYGVTSKSCLTSTTAFAVCRIYENEPKTEYLRPPCYIHCSHEGITPKGWCMWDYVPPTCKILLC